MRSLKQIQQKLSDIKKMGYVPTLRTGSTGVGFTLETLLDIKENNISSPDLGHIELKAQRAHHKGMTTLFTFNKNAWKMAPLEAIRKYGSKDKKSRLGLYYTMGLTPNHAGLFLSVQEQWISVRSVEGSLIAQWKLEDIVRRFNQKVRSVLLVKAHVEEREGVEHFYYHKARLLSGGVTQSILKNQFENGLLYLDLRLHDKGQSARNHGTGFRIYEKDLESFYQTCEEIEL